jgi:hypothetical protein
MFKHLFSRKVLMGKCLDVLVLITNRSSEQGIASVIAAVATQAIAFGYYKRKARPDAHKNLADLK